MSPRYIVPREHGAWSMLLLPFAAGLLIAGRVSWTIVPAAAALVAAFWLREPLILLARQAFIWRERRAETDSALRTAGISGAVLAGSSTALLLAELPVAPLLVLGAGGVGLGATSVWSAVRNRQRSLSLQLVTAAALGSGAILASVAATGAIQAWAWWVWGASSLHSVAAVAVVRARLDARSAASKARPRRRDLVAAAAALIAAGAAAAVAVALFGRAWLACAMAFSAAVHGWELVRLSDRAALATPLRRVGWRALAASVAFTALVIAGAA